MPLNIVIWLAVFVVSLAVLVKASDIFIVAAEKIGLSLGMSPFVIGVVIVGVGTSLPELVSSIVAVRAGSSEIVIGNVLGSNITNILLILGLAAIIAKGFKLQYDIMNLDLPIFFGSAILLGLMIFDGSFSLGEALFCIAGLLLYLASVLHTQVRQPQADRPPKAKAVEWLKLVGSPVLIFLGAKYTVEAVIALAAQLSIGAEVIALSAVALGTSLPEVLVTIAAARRGQAEMAVGNIIGSNIFNTFAVMGIPGLVGRLQIPENVIGFSLPVFLGSTLLYTIILLDRKVNRWEGMLLLLFYIFFLGKIYALL
jgi:cation:H+ antiporter